jgi:hypothetical protein
MQYRIKSEKHQRRGQGDSCQGVEKRQLGVIQNASDHTSREEERRIRRRNVSQI